MMPRKKKVQEPQANKSSAGRVTRSKRKNESVELEKPNTRRSKRIVICILLYLYLTDILLFFRMIIRQMIMERVNQNQLKLKFQYQMNMNQL